MKNKVVTQEQAPQKKYNFELTLNEANVVITALKKLPMEYVEALVNNMDGQFVKQRNAEQIKGDVAKAEVVKAVEPEVKQPKKLKKVAGSQQ